MNETRPGILTTEFWLALIVTLLGALAAVYAEPWAQVAGLVAAALAAAGYGFSRASVKRTDLAARAGAAERDAVIALQREQGGR